MSLLQKQAQLHRQKTLGESVEATRKRHKKFRNAASSPCPCRRFVQDPSWKLADVYAKEEKQTDLDTKIYYFQDNFIIFMCVVLI